MTTKRITIFDVPPAPPPPSLLTQRQQWVLLYRIIRADRAMTIRALILAPLVVLVPLQLLTAAVLLFILAAGSALMLVAGLLSALGVR